MTQIYNPDGGIESVVEDLTPQLGGDLDLNSNDITGTGNISITGEIEATTLIGNMRGATIFQAKAGEALSKGDPVYISGDDIVGNKPIVSIADSDDANKMPCFGLADETVSINSNVNVVTFGTLSGIDTSSFNQGDILYISTTGTLTATKPTGESALIQNIGKVMRSHASAGSIKVGGAGRTNDVPNLNDGNVFIGNASNQAETRGLTLDDISETATNKHFTASYETKLNGIENNATADQTASEIKTAYESNADTNAFTDAEKTKLAGIETGADVTDSTNVDAAGAVMNSDTTTTSMGFVIDEDTMVSNSATKVPTQQSVKAYVDANAGGIDPRDSFTQNSGQYIATEGIRARDVGGIAMMNNAGTAGVTVADSGDVDIITKMSASEIKARNVNGLKLHDDGGNGLIVKDGGATDATHLITSSGGIKAKGNPGTSFYADNETSVNIGTLNNDYGFIEINSSHAEGGWLDFTDASGSDFKGRLRYSNTNNRLEFYSNGQRRMVIDSNGNLGLGNSSPNERLHINGNFKLDVSSQFPMVVQKNGTPTNGVVAKFISNEGDHSWGVVAEFRVNGSAGADRPSILFSHGYSSTNWTVGFGSSTDDNFRINQNHGYLSSSWGTNRFFINTSGNVGIGTTSPSQKLHVAGGIMADDWFRVNGTKGFYCETYGGGWFMQDTTYMRVYGNKIIYTANDIRGNRFVDNQDTGRYVDASGTSELGNLVIDTELKIRRTGFRAGSHIAMKYYPYAYPGGGNYNTVHGALEFRAPQGWDSNDLVLTLKSEGFGNNYAQVNGNLSVSGSVSKGSGSFDIAHPDPKKKDTHRLRHYFVETPSAGGNIYKYQIECKKGDNYIDLPDYFKHLNENSLVWANPFKHFGRAWGEVIQGGKRAKIVVEETGIYNILIFGDRKDAIAAQEFEKYGVEYETNKEK